MKKTFTALLLAMLCIVGAKAQDYTVVPENGAVVEALTDITITWDDATSVSVDPAMMIGGAKAYVMSGEEKVHVSDIFCGPTTGNSATMSFMTATDNAGEYVVEVPQGMFTVDGTAASAITLNYSIGGVPVSVAGFDVQLVDGSLSSMTMTVTPCEELSLNAESTEKIQIIHNVGFGAYYAAEYTPAITGSNTASLTTTKALANGSYSLIIPKGVFIVDGMVNPEIVADFDLSEVNPAEKKTISPQDGSVVETLTDITITWDNAQAVTVAPSMMQGAAKVYYVAAEENVFVSDIFCGPAAGNSITMSLTSALNDAGDYVVEIPDSMFTVDGIVIDEFSLSYTIEGILTSPATFEMQLAEGSMNDVLVTITPCDEVLINPENTEAIKVIHNTGFDSSYVAEYTATVTGANTVTLHTEVNLAPGDYTLIVPKGYFLVNEMVNPELLFEFSKSAVTSVLNDADAVNVYNIAGILVVNNGSQEDLRQLQPGIYIVNGKKMFVSNNK